MDPAGHVHRADLPPDINRRDVGTGAAQHATDLHGFDPAKSQLPPDKQHELTKYKPSDFGLPGYLDQFCESKGVCQMPRVNIDGYQQLSRDVNRQSDETTNIQGQFNATQVRGSHTLRGGVGRDIGAVGSRRACEE